MKCITIISYLTLFIILRVFPVSAAEREIRFLGLKIHSAEYFTKELFSKIQLPPDKPFMLIEQAVTEFLYAKGYHCASVYLADEDVQSVTIYIDEGMLGNIVFKGLDDISIVRAKLMFSVDKRIFEKTAVDKELAQIAGKIKVSGFDYTLIPVPDYSRNFIQLDGVYRLPVIPQSAEFPFFERYGYRYDIEIRASERPGAKNSVPDQGRLTFSASLFYTGIKPLIKYRKQSLISADDSFSAHISGAFSYFKNRSFKETPSIASSESGLSYRCAEFKEILRPGASFLISYAGGSRPDIRYTSYRYIAETFSLDPSLKILEPLKFFPGAGIERFRFFDRKTTADEDRTNAHSDTAYYWFLSARLEFERLVTYLNPFFTRNTSLSLHYFRSGSDAFKKWLFLSHYDFSGYGLDIITLDVSGFLLTGSAPFYKHDSVSGGAFRGFTGKPYYSKKDVKAEIEYRTSIHRGYLFIGPFADGTIFSPVDKKLPRHSYGMCGGIAAHAIIFDQFELNSYLGKDYYVKKRESGWNVSFSAIKHF